MTDSKKCTCKDHDFVVLPEDTLEHVAGGDGEGGSGSGVSLICPSCSGTSFTLTFNDVANNIQNYECNSCGMGAKVNLTTGEIEYSEIDIIGD